MGTVADADGKVCHYYHLTPIGGIVPWAKSLTGVPALSEAWMECDGSAITDAESPMYGQNVPDLNSSLGAGLRGRFLRGHTVSGLTESSANLAHTHSTAFIVGPTGVGPGYTGGNVGGYTLPTNSSGGTEARPSNYSVVFIIRIK